MTRKLLIASFGIALLAVAGTAFAAFAPTDWKFVAPLVGFPRIAPGDYVKVNLTNEVSMGARADLADLRVVSGGVEEVPFQLVVENAENSRAYVPATVRDIVADGLSGDPMIIVDLGKSGLVHNNIEIQTDSKNFKRQVSIFASDMPLPHSAKGWNEVNRSYEDGADRIGFVEGYIYNFYDPSLGFNSGNTVVHYPDNTSRYLRVVIHSDARGESDKPFVVLGARVFQHVERGSKESTLALIPTIVENPKDKTTEFTVDLGGGGVPTHEVELPLLLSGNGNFDRRALVEGSADGVRWQQLGRGSLFSVHTPLFSGYNNTIAYQESSARYIRVTIWNDDNKPLQFMGPTESTTLSKIYLKSVMRSVVFAPEPGKSYSLYYGNDKAIPPRYDLARFFVYIDWVNLPAASIGARTVNPELIAPPPETVPFMVKNKNLLNGALVLLVAIVSFLLISYLKKLKLEKPRP